MGRPLRIKYANVGINFETNDVDTGASTITVSRSYANFYVNSAPVQYLTETLHIPVGGLSNGSVYFIRNTSANSTHLTFQLSSTVNGSIISLTSTPEYETHSLDVVRASGVQEMSNTDVANVITPILLNRFVNPITTPVSGLTLQINDSSNATSIGVYTDTHTVESPNTVVGPSPSYSNTTYTFYQTNNVPSSLDPSYVIDGFGNQSTVRPVHYVEEDGIFKIKEMSNDDIINNIAPIVVNQMLQSNTGCYYLSNTGSIAGRTVVEVATFEDNYWANSTTETSDTYYLLRDTTAQSVPTKGVRPLIRKRSGYAISNNNLEEAEDDQISAIANLIGEYIRTTGIGSYLLQVSAPGVGTWQSQGTITNSVNDIGGVPYAGAYAQAFTQNYTGTYTQAYTGTFSQQFAGAFVNEFTNTYVNSYQGPAFTGINYTTAFTTNYQTAYTQVYTIGFATPYSTVYTQQFTGGFTTNYTSTFVGLYTGNYVGVFSQSNYTALGILFTGSVKYTSLTTAFYAGWSGLIAYAGAGLAAYQQPQLNYQGVYTAVYFTGTIPYNVFTGPQLGYPPGWFYYQFYTGAGPGLAAWSGSPIAYVGSYVASVFGAWTGPVVPGYTSSGVYTGPGGGYVGTNVYTAGDAIVYSAPQLVDPFAGPLDPVVLWTSTYVGLYTRVQTVNWVTYYTTAFNHPGLYSLQYTGAYLRTMLFQSSLYYTATQIDRYTGAVLTAWTAEYTSVYSRIYSNTYTGYTSSYTGRIWSTAFTVGGDTFTAPTLYTGLIFTGAPVTSYSIGYAGVFTADAAVYTAAGAGVYTKEVALGVVYGGGGYTGAFAAQGAYNFQFTSNIFTANVGDLGAYTGNYTGLPNNIMYSAVFNVLGPTTGYTVVVQGPSPVYSDSTPLLTAFTGLYPQYTGPRVYGSGIISRPIEDIGVVITPGESTNIYVSSDPFENWSGPIVYTGSGDAFVRSVGVNYAGWTGTLYYTGNGDISAGFFTGNIAYGVGYTRDLNVVRGAVYSASTDVVYTSFAAWTAFFIAYYTRPDIGAYTGLVDFGPYTASVPFTQTTSFAAASWSAVFTQSRLFTTRLSENFTALYTTIGYNANLDELVTIKPVFTGQSGLYTAAFTILTNTVRTYTGNGPTYYTNVVPVAGVFTRLVYDVYNNLGSPEYTRVRYASFTGYASNTLTFTSGSFYLRYFTGTMTVNIVQPAQTEAFAISSVPLGYTGTSPLNITYTSNKTYTGQDVAAWVDATNEYTRVWTVFWTAPIGTGYGQSFTNVYTGALPIPAFTGLAWRPTVFSGLHAVFTKNTDSYTRSAFAGSNVYQGPSQYTGFFTGPAIFAGASGQNDTPTYITSYLTFTRQWSSPFFTGIFTGIFTGQLPLYFGGWSGALYDVNYTGANYTAAFIGFWTAPDQYYSAINASDGFTIGYTRDAITGRQYTPSYLQADGNLLIPAIYSTNTSYFSGWSQVNKGYTGVLYDFSLGPIGRGFTGTIYNSFTATTTIAGTYTKETFGGVAYTGPNEEYTIAVQHLTYSSPNLLNFTGSTYTARSFVGYGLVYTGVTGSWSAVWTQSYSNPIYTGSIEGIYSDIDVYTRQEMQERYYGAFDYTGKTYTYWPINIDLRTSQPVAFTREFAYQGPSYTGGFAIEYTGPRISEVFSSNTGGNYTGSGAFTGTGPATGFTGPLSSYTGTISGWTGVMSFTGLGLNYSSPSGTWTLSFLTTYTNPLGEFYRAAGFAGTYTRSVTYTSVMDAYVSGLEIDQTYTTIFTGTDVTYTGPGPDKPVLIANREYTGVVSFTGAYWSLIYTGSGGTFAEPGVGVYSSEVSWSSPFDYTRVRTYTSVYAEYVAAPTTYTTISYWTREFPVYVGVYSPGGGATGYYTGITNTVVYGQHNTYGAYTSFASYTGAERRITTASYGTLIYYGGWTAPTYSRETAYIGYQAYSTWLQRFTGGLYTGPAVGTGYGTLIYYSPPDVGYSSNTFTAGYTSLVYTPVVSFAAPSFQNYVEVYSRWVGNTWTVEYTRTGFGPEQGFATGSWTQNELREYTAGVWSGLRRELTVYKANSVTYIGTYTKTYTRLAVNSAFFTKAYAAVLTYTGNYVIQTHVYTLPIFTNVQSGYSPSLTNSYYFTALFTAGTFTGTGPNWSINYTVNVTLTFNGIVYTRNEIVPSAYTNIFTLIYTGNYTGTVNEFYSEDLGYQGLYTHTDAGSYAGIYTTAYSAFTATLVPVGFTGQYTQIYSLEYTTNYTAPAYTTEYTQLYAPLYTPTYTTLYTTAYTTEFTGLYTTLFTGAFGNAFTGSYADSYTNSFTGTFTGGTVLNTTTTETLTLWVRIA